MGKKYTRSWHNIHFGNFKDIDWKEKFLHHERHGPPGNFWGTNSGLHKDGLIEKKGGDWSFKKGVSDKERWAAFGKHTGNGNARDGYIRFNIDDIDEDNYNEVNWQRQYENKGFTPSFLDDPSRQWVGGKDKKDKWLNFIDKLELGDSTTNDYDFASWGASTDFSPTDYTESGAVTLTDEQKNIQTNIKNLGTGTEPTRPTTSETATKIPALPTRPVTDTLDVTAAPAEVDHTPSITKTEAAIDETSRGVPKILSQPLTDTELGTGGVDTLQDIDDTYTKYQPTAIKDLDTTIDDIKTKSNLFQTDLPDKPVIQSIEDTGQGFKDQFAQFDSPRSPDRRQILSAMGSKLRQSSSARAGRTTLGTGAFKHRTIV